MVQTLPYKALINIASISNFPSGASRPYVIVTSDDGNTSRSTAYNLKNKEYVSEEYLTASLASKSSKIHLKIYCDDHHFFSFPSLTLPLTSSTPSNPPSPTTETSPTAEEKTKEINFIDFYLSIDDLPVNQRVSSQLIVNRLTISYNLTIKFNENIIKIQKIDQKEKKNNKNLLDKLELNYPSEFLTTFTNSIHESEEVNINELQDIIKDASLILNPDLPLSAEENIFYRKKLLIDSSTRIYFPSFDQELSSPVGINEIILNLSPNDAIFYSLTFTNRFFVWNWIKWLKIAFQYWNSLEKNILFQLPAWAQRRSFSSRVQFNSNECKQSIGKLLINLDKPFVLQYQNDSLPINSLASLIFSSDSTTSSSHIFKFNAYKSNQGENNEKSQRFFSKIGGKVRGSITTLSNKATDTAKGAVRTLSTANPVYIVKEAHDKVLSMGRDIATTITSAPKKLGKNNLFICLRYKNHFFKISCLPNSLIDQSEFYFDIDMKKINKSYKSHSFLTEKKVSNESSKDSPKGSSTQITPHIDFFYLSGPEGLEKVVNTSMLKLSSLFGKKIYPQSDLIPINEINITELDLKSMTYYTIILESMNDFILPPDKPTSTIQFKFKFVDANGHSGYKSTEYFSEKVAPNQNCINFSHQFIKMAISDHIGNDRFIRIEFLIPDVPNPIYLYSAFIPIEIFDFSEKSVTVPLTHFRSNNSLIQFAGKEKKSLGSLTVKIQKTLNDIDDTQPTHLGLDWEIYENNIFTNRWLGETNIYGSDFSESFLITLGNENLTLTELKNENVSNISWSNSLTSKPSDVSSEDLSNNSLHSLQETITSNQYEIIDIEVWENERRIIGALGWSSNDFRRSRYTNLDYQVSYGFEDISKAIIPDGCEWVSEWNYQYLKDKTDRDGWIYGLTFTSILAGQNKGITNPSDRFVSARRRRWTRKLKIPLDLFDARTTIFSFQSINNKVNFTASIANKLQTIQNLGTNMVSTATSFVGITKVKDEQCKEHEWRHNILSKTPDAILTTCKEKPNLDSAITIEWDKITSTYPITESILSVTLSINRFFSNNNGCFFRPAEVELFISNCSSFQLKNLIDDRIFFYEKKKNIQTIISQGTLYPKDSSVDSSGDLINESNIETSENLSFGSEVVAELDNLMIDLDLKISETKFLIENFDKDADEHIENEKLTKKALKKKKKKLIYKYNQLSSRFLRTKVLLDVLLTSNLKGLHDFNEVSTRNLIEKDIQRASRIQLNSPIRTANCRIEYLIDIAEKRIRDASLCGWKYLGNGLEKCLELFANQYYLEIVSILGVFFNQSKTSSSSTESTKSKSIGLGDNIELVRSFIFHSDRLDLVLKTALRPYGLVSSPKVSHDLFLDLNVLLTWISISLEDQMLTIVNNVINVWKDVKSDVTGNASLYQYPIPWIPLRNKTNTSSMFFTKIPEDLAEYLKVALQEVLTSFKNVLTDNYRIKLNDLENKVIVSYLNSYLYLAELIEKEIKTCPTIEKMDEEELIEYITWICSVVNDVQRVLTGNIFYLYEEFIDNYKKQQDKVFFEETLPNILASVKLSYKRIFYHALNQLSSIFLFISLNNSLEILNNSLTISFKQFVQDYEKKSLELKKNPLFLEDFLSNLFEIIDSYFDYLDSRIHFSLFNIILSKLTTIFFALLKDLRNSDEVFLPTSIFMVRLQQDGYSYQDKLKNLRTNFLRNEEKSNHKADSSLLVSEDLVSIDIIIPLLDLFNSIELQTKAIKSIEEIAKNVDKPKFYLACANAIETCLSLRGETSFMNPSQAQNLKKQTGSISILSSNTSNSAYSLIKTTFNSAPNQQEKPKSKFNIFNLGKDHTNSPQTPPPHENTSFFSWNKKKDNQSGNRSRSNSFTEEVPSPSSYSSSTHAISTLMDDDEDPEDIENKNLIENNKKNFFLVFANDVLEKLKSSSQLSNDNELGQVNFPSALESIFNDKYSLRAVLFQSHLSAANRELYHAKKNDFSINLSTNSFFSKWSSLMGDSNSQNSNINK